MACRPEVPWGDVEDVAQDLALAVLAARPRFDPNLGGREEFARVVVERAGANILRGRRAAMRNPARVCSLATLPEDAEPPDPESVAAGSTDLALDVAHLLEQLPEAISNLARALQEHTFAGAARALGIPRTTLYRRLTVLREVFIQAGLRDYFVESADTPEGRRVTE